MEDDQFDDLTRSLARSTSRRGLLRGLAAGLAGMVAPRRPVDAARPPRQPLGSACARATDCASFFCVDGVCCDGPCTGQCEACNAQGVCTPVTGSPVGTRAACAGSGPCVATCDGQTTGHCVGFPGAETSCGESSCADGWQTVYACGGDGSCHPTTTSCGLFVCDLEGLVCLTTCATDDDCLGAAFCSSSGVCQGDLGLGEPCAGPDQCQYGFCVSGVCCDAACEGLCQACDIAGSAGYCTELPDGTGCGGEKTCASGDCVCPSGTTDCGATCTDTQTDPANCGACGDPCAAGEMCCAGVCFDTDTDTLNCGGCGVHCRVSERCSGGVCVCPGFPGCGDEIGICCTPTANLYLCVCVPSGGAVDPLTCDFSASCPAGSTLCAGLTGTCGSGLNQSCCPAGTTCDLATGTCFL